MGGIVMALAELGEDCGFWSDAECENLPRFMETQGAMGEYRSWCRHY